jgi:DNA helicase-2/ATP-dependent DNA helicase PcrA
MAERCLNVEAESQNDASSGTAAAHTATAEVEPTAATANSVEPEVDEALAAVAGEYDFVIQGGAGSGKTFSMLSFIEKTLQASPNAQIQCVTYTNVAVNEIRARFSTPNLSVSTIHEFFFQLLFRYQPSVKESLAALINAGAITSDLELPVAPEIWPQAITYKEWPNVASGEISHDEVLLLTHHMFTEYDMLKRIFTDLCDYLLVDEYQDTPPTVLDVLLTILPSPSDRRLRIGFFGDSEQAIYQGSETQPAMTTATSTGRVKKIVKKHNRRNPSAVLRVANNLRSDGLVQEQSTDPLAPNYEKLGSAHFLYSDTTRIEASDIKKLDICSEWSLDSSRTKLLFLGKSMIAREHSFSSLMAIYDKDRHIDYAMRIRVWCQKNDREVDHDASFGEVVDAFASLVPATAGQSAAFQSQPSQFELARGFKFGDIVTTSSNSDRLIGVKKVSDYDDRDRGSKRDALIELLLEVATVHALSEAGKYNAVIRRVKRKVESIAHRKEIAESLAHLKSISDEPIKTVLDFSLASGLVRTNDDYNRFVSRHPYRRALVEAISFHEIIRLYQYVEDHSPYSTQHGVKGSEWENIFVSLDNGGWTNYNFSKLMLDPSSTNSVVVRSRMMMYVACSRAKERLVVYMHQPSEEVINRAKSWFGADNVVGLN